MPQQSTSVPAVDFSDKSMSVTIPVEATSSSPKLTHKSVRELFMKCLFNDGEDTSNAIFVNGIISNVGFHPERIEQNRQAIKELLEELPSNFKEEVGGGWSFLQAAADKNGRLWGDHRSMEELFLLGMATGNVKCLLSKELWSALPGGMPYYSIINM